MEARGTLDRSARRARLHAMWDSVATAWGAQAAFVDARGRELTTVLLGLTEPAPGERVLELAAGPAGVGLAAARMVGADGEVVVSDVSPRMTAIAAGRAAARELERIAVPDGSFDVVLCREGLMLVPDPPRRRGRSWACCGRAAGSRSPSGGRGRATRGSASSSTR